MDLIRNFIIGQELTIGKLKIVIMEYAGITLIRTNTGIAEMQLYKINVDGLEAYASDSGLLSNNSAIFNRVIANIGYRGNIDINIFKTEYEMWKEMIYHCYYQSNKLYPYYGGIGITIDPRWLCFEIFLYDLINLNGYEKIKDSKCEYVIDIKSKQKNTPESSRIYAPGKISLKQYYKSDVYDNNEKAKASGMASDAGLYYNSSVQPMHNTERKPFFKRLSDGSYPEYAYEYTVNNPPILQSPDNDDLGINKIRTFNGVHYKNAKPISPKSKK